MPVEREQLEADVLIVGAGPAGLSCALHLAGLIERHTQAGKTPSLSAENIYVVEKARELGAHQLSGAILDPRALRELVPDFENTAPLDTRVTGDAAYYFTGTEFIQAARITPPPLQNHGNYVVSLNKLVKWLGGLVEQKGVNVFTQFAGRELLYDKNGIKTCRRRSPRIRASTKERQAAKTNFTPGYELARRKSPCSPKGRAARSPRISSEKPEARWAEPAGLRHRHQRALGSAARAHRNRLRRPPRSAGRCGSDTLRAAAGSAWPARKSRLARHGRRPRISQSAF